MRSSFSMFLLYHAYVYLEFLILACTIYILAPFTALFLISEGTADIEIRGLPEGGIVSVEGGV